MEANKVIIQPVLTEKTNIMREGESKKYAFKVSPAANKYQVMDAVKELFSVNPVKCNILTVKSKPRVTRTKSGMRRGRTTPWKKAVVTLKQGEKIDAFEGV